MGTVDNLTDEELEWLAKICDKPDLEPPEHVVGALRKAGVILPTKVFPTVLASTVVYIARQKGRLPPTDENKD